MVFKLIYLNSRSIMNKLIDIQLLLCNESPDLLLITESWLHGDISNSEITFKGFRLIDRKDRLDTIKGRGGGTTIW